MAVPSEALERYTRQMRFPGIGKAGQEKLLASRVTLCGCGALGTVLANVLVRAGVGFVRIIDRDFIEPRNLQRQVLFDESDVANNLPKAEAAATQAAADQLVGHGRAGRRGHRPHQHRGTCATDADLILDGTDNFEIRYLINDVAVKHGKPWVYGGAIGSQGQTMTIIPGETPCLRCVFEAAPGAGRGRHLRDGRRARRRSVNIVASYQATEAIKILTGNKARGQPRADLCRRVGEHEHGASRSPRSLGKGECPCCAKRKLRVAGRRARHADDEPVRPERGAGGAPRGGQARLRVPRRRAEADAAR